MARASRNRSSYACQHCGHSAPRWLGRCPSCDEWNSFVEEPAGSRSLASVAVGSAAPVTLQSVESGGEAARLVSGTEEIDRVLGGGLVAGSTVLLGGDPGIGKSTLALQLAGALAASGATALYVAGEEAAAQVKLRAERLGLGSVEMLVLAETNVGTVCEAIRRSRPSVAVIDSIQTVFSSDLESAPGSVAQIREVSAQLVRLARELECAMVLIGHVTKEGFLAGPRVLEHLVDTVLYFEGDRNHAFRILRAVKNRFGPANEIGVFEMSAQGLSQVVNPSEVLSGGLAQSANGSVVTPCLEGSRPMLVEVQALVSPGLPGSARRTTLGVDHNRVAMIAAVMEKHMGLTMISHDIFVNTAGGVRIDDPGVDLAVLASLASSYLERSVARGTVVLGEIGLTGDVRAVSQVRARVREAARLGFTRAVLPAGSLEQARSVGGLEALGVESVSDAWELIAATSR